MSYYLILFYRRDLAPHLFHVELTSIKRDISNSVVNVTRIIHHPSFTVQPSLRHDLALFKLTTVPPVTPVCLHQTLSDYCYVVGWGSVDGQSKF